MTTKITPSVLANTAVTSGYYGSASVSLSIVVDAQGRIVSAGNNNISIDTSQLGSGTLADARLPAQADLTASAGRGNTNTAIAIVTDAKGRIKSAANVPIQITTAQITGYPTFAASATTDTTNANFIIAGTLNTARLADSGVSATTYGTASSVSRVTVDAKGRITSASNVAIAIASGAVSGLAASATTDTTNANFIIAGTLNTARLADSGVIATTYGTASAVPTITVDAKGRVTAASATSIAIGAGAVSGLASVATTGEYGDLSGRPTITAPVNADFNATSGLAQILNKPATYSPPQGIATTSNTQFNSLGIGVAASTITGEIRASGGVTAGYSDDRLKTKLGNIENALDKIDELSGFYYEENELAELLGYTKHRQVGVSAQQVQKQLPDCDIVVPAPINNKYLTVHYEKLVPLLIEGIKELRAEVKELKNSI